MWKIMLFEYCIVVLFNLNRISAKVVIKHLEPIETEDRFNKTLAAGIGKNKQPPKVLVLHEAVLEQSPWHLGVVPYYFNHKIYDPLVSERVRLSMNAIEEASCVQFMPILKPWSDVPWIHITNPDGIRFCVHEINHVNISKTERIMVLGFDCLRKREILHSLMHALGFKDEVTHPQRNKFIRVNWDNIHPRYHPLFHIDHYNFPTKTIEYDGMSIMQFHDRAFSKNGRATISSLVPGLVINPSKELSPLDRMKLRQMFGHDCNKRKVENIVEQCKYALQPDPNKSDNDYVGGDYDGGDDDHTGGDNSADGDIDAEDGDHDQSGKDDCVARDDSNYDAGDDFGDSDNDENAGDYDQDGFSPDGDSIDNVSSGSDQKPRKLILINRVDKKIDENFVAREHNQDSNDENISEDNNQDGNDDDANYDQDT